MSVTTLQPLPISLRPFLVVACCLVAGLAACPDAGFVRDAAAVEPQPIIVRGRRLPVLPGRAARMAARGEIFAIVPPPAQPPFVIREQAPPVVIRERVATGGLREQVRGALGSGDQARGAAGRDLPARMSEMARVAAEVAQALQAPGSAAAGSAAAGSAAVAPAAQAAAGKAPAAVNPPAKAAAASPFDSQGVEPASVLVPQKPAAAPATPQPAETLPPIELLPTP